MSFYFGSKNYQFIFKRRKKIRSHNIFNQLCDKQDLAKIVTTKIVHLIFNLVEGDYSTHVLIFICQCPSELMY